MEFLRRLFPRHAPDPSVAPPTPDLPDDPSWFTMHEGLPYPEWQTIFDWLDSELPDTAHAEALNHTVRLWLTKLRHTTAAGPGLHLSESPHFLLLSPFQPNGRKWTLKTLELVRLTIVDRLADLAWPDVREKVAVLILDHDPYNLYISRYFPGDYMGRTAGLMITGGGYAHIAAEAPSQANYGDTPLVRILTHELTHHALGRLDLPRWLDEALAMSFEDQMAGSESALADRLGSSFEGISTRALLQEFAAWWTEERLQGFWSGSLWNSEDDEQGFCYEMSRILFRLLTQASHHATVRLRQFIGEASWNDAGEAAAQQHLGLGLGEVAAEFLGDGNWAPAPKRWNLAEA
jgi:hypothetical protein